MGTGGAVHMRNSTQQRVRIIYLRCILQSLNGLAFSAPLGLTIERDSNP